MHFHTAQLILTKLGGDIHRVRGSCIVYIARTARVHYGCAQRANVIIRVFLAGGIRASISRPLHRSLPNLVETFTRSGGFVYAILCTQRAGVTGLHSVRTLFCRFFLIKLILNQTWWSHSPGRRELHVLYLSQRYFAGFLWGFVREFPHRSTDPDQT